MNRNKNHLVIANILRKRMILKNVNKKQMKFKLLMNINTIDYNLIS